MAILVTGANGFIGRHVIKALSLAGSSIIATSLEPTLHSDLADTPLRYIQANLNHTNVNYWELFNHPERLIHLAWGGLADFKHICHIEENVFTSYRFISHLVNQGLKDVTVTGTCLEYGIQEGCLSESLDPRPTTAYGVAKDALRRFLDELRKVYPFFFKWIRLFYLYGYGQSEKAILPQLKRALLDKAPEFKMSGGDQLRDYLPVEKVADKIVRISQQDRVQGIINCCSGQPISVRTLVEGYLRETKQSINLNLGYYPYPDYEPMAFWGDPSKLEMIGGC